MRLNLGDPTRAGAYRAVVTNAHGAATSQVMRVTLHYINAAGVTPTLPYSDWSSAATNIQDAIDVAKAGDFVVVTNGTYRSGGKVMYGDLTNRVALDKALTVMSVNGPVWTAIEGKWDPATTNGAASVRGVWLADGATIRGFTLQGGSTRPSSGDQLGSGGGVWCASRTATVLECWLKNNAAASSGGGAYSGTLKWCEVSRNTAQFGGGVQAAMVKNCQIRENKAALSGGGVGSGSVVNNSWIAGNSAANGGGVYSSGAIAVAATNCTIIHNFASAAFGGVSRGEYVNCIVSGNVAPSYPNYSAAVFQFTCTSPLASGQGNFDADPQFLSDGFHLSATSPCRSAGTNLSVGVDADGQPWASPPSIGCDEWDAHPVAGVPSAEVTREVGEVAVTVAAAGQEPITCFWRKDGVLVEDSAHYSSAHTSRLLVRGFGPGDAGAYQAVVSNVFGVVTSQVAQVVVHCVSAEGSNPVPPFHTWATAATNIQDAIDAAASGALVVVSNGVYSTGGKVMDGDLTNRVALDKPLSVMSVNGPEVTVIQGTWHPGTTNGPSAVRCVWLTNGATLSGFTVRHGATREIGGTSSEMSGGGIWSASTSAQAINCLIVGNAAFYHAGGAYPVTLVDCSLTENIARSYGTPGASAGSSGRGGGAALCDLFNCRVSGNTAFIHGGGVADCRLWNCVLTGNSAYLYGGAAYQSTLVHSTAIENVTGGYGGYGAAVAYCTLTNSIVFGNSLREYTSFHDTNVYSCSISYSCTDPLAAGEGNIDIDPQLLADGVHLASASPCIGMGTNLTGGVDIDGQAWADPPSMGCDEWHSEPIIALQPAILPLSGPGQCRMGGALLVGQEPFTLTWRKDGEQVTFGSHYELTPLSDMVVRDFGPSDAGDYEMVVSNDFGAATSSIVKVKLHCVDAAGAMPTTPFSEWATAATTIQDAIESADAGDFILVTNGVYATGGKGVEGDLTNRVTLDKPVQLISINGPQHTIVQGQYDPVSTNGPAAVRCAWLTNGAVLNGFTLIHGATRSGSVPTSQTTGGGIACASIVDSYVVNCVITSNSATFGGGGSRGGRLVSCAIIGNRAEARFAGGGGALGGYLLNCTIAGNYAGYIGGGVQDADLTNCIVYFNDASFTGAENVIGSGITYSCAPGLNGLGGNISENPQLVDGYHIATTSPCRGAGEPWAATGVDVDGEEWANPPSIGCDEVWEDALVGPIAVSASVWPEQPVERTMAYVSGSVTGRVSRVAWDFGDGSSLTNASYLWSWRSWTNAGDYTVTFTAYNTDHPEGVATNYLLHVLPIVAPQLSIVAEGRRALT